MSLRKRIRAWFEDHFPECADWFDDEETCGQTLTRGGQTGACDEPKDHLGRCYFRFSWGTLTRPTEES